MLSGALRSMNSSKLPSCGALSGMRMCLPKAPHNVRDFWAAPRRFCTSSASSTKSSGFLNFAKENPQTFQIGVAIVKTSAADLMAQVVVEKKEFSDISWKRNMIFVIFGGAYLGAFQGWLMINCYGRWFPTMAKFGSMPLSEKLKWTAGMMDAAKMVLFDVLVHLPFMYFPTFYVVKEFVYGSSWNPIDWVKSGVGKWSNNLTEDWAALLKLWGPSDCIQFMIPVWMRMPFRHLVSFFWTAYVSFTRAR